MDCLFIFVEDIFASHQKDVSAETPPGSCNEIQNNNSGSTTSTPGKLNIWLIQSCCLFFPRR